MTRKCSFNNGSGLRMLSVCAISAAVIGFGSIEATAGLPAPPGVNVHVNGGVPAPPAVNVHVSGGVPAPPGVIVSSEHAPPPGGWHKGRHKQKHEGRKLGHYKEGKHGGKHH